MASHDQIAEFLGLATWHGSLEKAEEMLAAHPEIAGSGIHAAAVLGDDTAVRKFLAAEPECVRCKTAPYDGEPLVYLCLSKYLRLDESRSDAFLRAATALLDAGADPNAGFWTKGQHPEFETPMYGAAGVAQHEGLTRLLLSRGGEPNDDETPYHSPETGDLGALKALVESGKLTPDSLATMLLRKADWHDYEGIKYLLEHGADPNRMTHWGYTALHQSVRRDNGLMSIEVMLEHGADPEIKTRAEKMSVTAIAARRGRGDVLAAIEKRGIAIQLAGVEKLIAACARNDAVAARSIAAAEPHLLQELLQDGATLLAEFAGTNNTEGVALLLELGVPVNGLYKGDGYFGVAPESMALHVAAWKGWPRVVKLLIERGAPVNVADGKGRTPLQLAVRACVDSYWTGRRSPDSVAALLGAGASTTGVKVPCGYQEVDDLLAHHA